jgi:hypothetical protein
VTVDAFTFAWQSDTCVRVLAWPKCWPLVALVHGQDQPDVIRKTWRLLSCLKPR